MATTPPGPAAPRKRRREEALHVFVSQHHNSALRNLHLAIRRKQIPFSGITMLHVDSHPDLCAPEFPADVCFDPHELYYQLESSVGGIAEFVLPAAYAGHLDRVVWLRPPWSNQIRDGRSRFLVGKELDAEAAAARIRVTSRAPYWVDEGMSVPPCALTRVRELELYVTTVPVTPQEHEELSCVLAEGAWCLDVCLDYFSCRNPFMEELRRTIGAERAVVVERAYALPRWRRVEQRRIAHEEDDPVRSAEDRALQQRERRAFEAALTGLYARLVVVEEGGDEALAPERAPPDEAPLELGVLRDLYEAEDAGAATALWSLLCNLTPKERGIAKAAGEMADLPEHVSDAATVEHMFRELSEFLRRGAGIGTKQPQKRPPAVVTVALSSGDNCDYTPREQTESLLGSVLEMVRGAFGKIKVIYDDDLPAEVRDRPHG